MCKTGFLCDVVQFNTIFTLEKLIFGLKFVKLGQGMLKFALFNHKRTFQLKMCLMHFYRIF